MPNLALMHISAGHKMKGDTVVLEKFGTNRRSFVPDKVYISCIFRENRSQALGIARMFTCPVEIGGPGVDLKTCLPPEIEHLMPDYSLYHADFSMGFFSRGCIRKCPWCIVPRKEGNIRKNAPITEFLYPTHKKLVLLDNNLLACPEWNEALTFIAKNKVKVSICQGLDIRLVDSEKAQALNKIHAYTPSFKTSMFYFAFDDITHEDQVRRGVAILNKAGIKSKRQTFYILAGFKEPYDFAEDMHRFQVIRELGANPYVMKYNDRKDIKILNDFDRWVNYRLYTVCGFKDYDPNKKRRKELLHE